MERGLCVKCKGRLFCGLHKCPLLEKKKNYLKIKERLKDEFIAYTPPSIFITWKKYPKVDVAPLASFDNSKKVSFYDMPENWFGLDANKIISFRESLIMPYKSFEKEDAAEPSYELLEIQESAMTIGSLMSEYEIKEKPKLEVSFSEYYAPVGPKAEMKRFDLLENPKIPRKVDYLNSDTDAKASDAIYELYNSGFQVSYLSKILSIGTLGIERKRKLVPTRWAITAVDSTLADKLIEEKIKNYNKIDCYKIFHSEYLENTFYILLMPYEWSFEQLEAWKAGSFWNRSNEEVEIISDYELYEGRKEYAANVSGAYYAAKLAVAEYLVKEKIQASVIVFREISDKYQIPLGVWQIRENVRNAMKNKYVEFNNLDDALLHLSKRLSVNISAYTKKSVLIDKIKKQKRIIDFF
ncbi:MAG: Nre family DNA repair protein [Candidatus Diapherotrites archaeon]|nr:Nre family DNA repair protein [Candidatus Diapherotrites archaeon]